MSQSLSSAAGPQASRPPNAAGPSTKAQEAAFQNSGTEIRDAIRSEALAMGFDAVGFAEARLAEEARDNLGEVVARGYHGDMGWLADTAARRGDPQVLWPEARTVVVLGMNYGGPDDPIAAAGDLERGEISVYARGRDYHDTIKKR